MLGWVTPDATVKAIAPPAVAFRRNLHRRELVAVGLLQATSL